MDIESLPTEEEIEKTLAELQKVRAVGIEFQKLGAILANGTWKSEHTLNMILKVVKRR